MTTKFSFDHTHLINYHINSFLTTNVLGNLNKICVSICHLVDYKKWKLMKMVFIKLNKGGKKSLQVEEMEVEFAMQEGFLVDSFYLPSEERYRHTPMSVS